MATVQRSIRSIVTRVFHAFLGDSEIVTSSGINVALWKKRVKEHLKQSEPTVYEALEEAGVDHILHTIGEECIRSSRKAEVENIRELGKIVKEQEKLDEKVRVKRQDGTYSLKKLRDCTPSELDILADQYARSAMADMRRSQFYSTVARQLRLAGCQEDESMETFSVRAGMAVVATGTDS